MNEYLLRAVEALMRGQLLTFKLLMEGRTDLPINLIDEQVRIYNEVRDLLDEGREQAP